MNLQFGIIHNPDKELCSNCYILKNYFSNLKKKLLLPPEDSFCCRRTRPETPLSLRRVKERYFACTTGIGLSFLFVPTACILPSTMTPATVNLFFASLPPVTA